MNPGKINLFLMFKLPAAFFCGVRLRELTAERSKATVKYGWKNSNPFKSMYFAVQSMAAELTTGALVMKNIQESGQKVSMLIVHHHGSFSKKAVGRITFTCEQGKEVKDLMEKAIESGEGHTLALTSIGKDEHGDEVSRYVFEWSIKVKSRP